MFEPDELLLALGEGDVRFIIIGGVAVGVHGYVRATTDLDIVPDPETWNLTRLAAVLRALRAEHVGLGDFSADEFPYDPTDPLQWVAGIDEDPAYSALAREAITVRFRDGEVRVCGLDHLRAMKQAAGRDQDLNDLRELSG